MFFSISHINSTQPNRVQTSELFLLDWDSKHWLLQLIKQIYSLHHTSRWNWTHRLRRTLLHKNALYSNVNELCVTGATELDRWRRTHMRHTCTYIGRHRQERGSPVRETCESGSTVLCVSLPYLHCCAAEGLAAAKSMRHMGVCVYSCWHMYYAIRAHGHSQTVGTYYILIVPRTEPTVLHLPLLLHYLIKVW